MGREMEGLFGGGDTQERRGKRDRRDRRDRDDREDKEARREHRRRAREFVDRYTSGDPTEGYSAAEAVEQLRHVAQEASPETLQRAARQTMGNMSDAQRADFARMLEQRRAGQGMVQIQRSGSGGGPGQPTAPGGDPLSDLFGGVLGGMAGGPIGSPGTPAGGMPDIGGLLGGLLGGASGASPDVTAHTQARGEDDAGSMFGGLGDFMGSPLGKAAIGGIAAFAMKELLDQDQR